MKEKLASSPGWLFFQSPSMMHMKGTGLHVGESFPWGTHPRLWLSWSPSKLLCSGGFVLMDTMEGLGAPVRPLSLTQFTTRVAKGPPPPRHVTQLFIAFPAAGFLGPFLCSPRTLSLSCFPPSEILSCVFKKGN